jgi:accessory gene regulator protein AgrB
MDNNTISRNVCQVEKFTKTRSTYVVMYFSFFLFLGFDFFLHTKKPCTIMSNLFLILFSYLSTSKFGLFLAE